MGSAFVVAAAILAAAATAAAAFEGGAVAAGGVNDALILGGVFELSVVAVSRRA